MYRWNINWNNLENNDNDDNDSNNKLEDMYVEDEYVNKDINYETISEDETNY